MDLKELHEAIDRALPPKLLLNPIVGDRAVIVPPMTGTGWRTQILLSPEIYNLSVQQSGIDAIKAAMEVSDDSLRLTGGRFLPDGTWTSEADVAPRSRLVRALDRFVDRLLAPITH